MDENELCHTCTVWKWNSYANFIHTSHMITTHPWVIDTLHQPIWELNISECHILCRNIWSDYIQKCAFQDHYITYILFSFFQDHFLVQSLECLYKCLNVCRQCVEVTMESPDVSIPVCIYLGNVQSGPDNVQMCLDNVNMCLNMSRCVCISRWYIHPSTQSLDVSLFIYMSTPCLYIFYNVQHVVNCTIVFIR